MKRPERRRFPVSRVLLLRIHVQPMSPSELTVRLVAGGLLILSNAFFVATEFALTRVPQFEKSEFQGHPGPWVNSAIKAFGDNCGAWNGENGHHWSGHAGLLHT